ncbi:MAG: hypothetical protein ACREYF_01800 [Gammaproteobacteria bacterium]
MNRHLGMLPVLRMTMAEDGTRDLRRSRPAGLLTLGIAVAMCCVLATGTAIAGGGVAADHAGERRFCTATTQAQFRACGFEKLDDFHVARAQCINISDRNAKQECFDTARQEREDGTQLCEAQRIQRLEICGELGEARYEPSFDPADFDSDYTNLTNPNPYFPLTIGYRWDYAGSLETNTIVALDETKLIEGVTCIVLNDKRYEDGLLVEDTDDWYGQRKNGTVDFCGEAVSNFETFPRDNPVRPERVSTDGQWKTGRDGVPTGTYIVGTPRVGDVHRSEFAPGVAEDTVRYLSTTYGYGSDPVLDEHVPQALVDLFCGNEDCLVSGENTGIEPGAFTRKYYARGVGFILGVDVETGKSVQLVGCSFDARCATLPTP